MAFEIGFGYRSGATLTYGVYRPDGIARTAAGTSATEVAGTGYYYAHNASIQKGDTIIVKEGTSVVLSANYAPIFSDYVLEQEVVVNGDFSDGGTSWREVIVGGMWAFTDGTATLSGANYDEALAQDINSSMVVGNTYLLSFDIVTFTAPVAACYVYVGDFLEGRWDYYITITAAGHHETTFTVDAEHASTDIGIVATFGNPYGLVSIDNISIKRVIAGLSEEAIALIKPVPVNTFNSGGGTKLI